MDKKIDLSIIVINFNTSSLTKKCLETVYQFNKNLNFEVIIVNNSTQKSEWQKLKDLLSKYQNVSIFNTQNRGFGTANNFGAKNARGKYLLLLNSDTLQIDNSIEKMIRFLEKYPKIAALSPFLYCKDQKTLQKHFFGDFPTLGSITFRRWKGRSIDLSKKIIYAPMVSAATMMIEKSKFLKIGGFDQNFFMYCEDDDLCRRLTEKGYKNAVLTSAKVIHLEGGSTTNFQIKKMYFKSQNYYWRKHNGPFWTSVMKIIRFPYKISLLAYLRFVN